MLELMSALEDNDDVQNVYANFEVSDALVAKAARWLEDQRGFAQPPYSRMYRPPL